jgi:hypothetical protein
LSGQAILAVLSTQADLDKYKGKLKGKIVLTSAPHDSTLEDMPLDHRLTDEELAESGERGIRRGCRSVLFAGPLQRRRWVTDAVGLVGTAPVERIRGSFALP